MATWKKVITANDDANYKNNSISLAQLDAGLDGETGYGANKILKVNSSGNAIEWTTDDGGIALTDLSMASEGTASGNGGVSYDNSNGEFTYTPPGSATASADGLATAAQITKLDAIASQADKYTSWTFGGDTEQSGLSTSAFAITSGETLTIAGGDSIATHRTNNTITINNQDPCDETHVKSVLAGLNSSDTLNIGDTGNDATINIRGNLTVNGTTTSIDTTQLAVADNNIVLNSDLTGTTMPNVAGIEIERGDYPNVKLQFSESTNQFFAAIPNHSTDGSASSVVNGTLALLQQGTASTGNADRQTVGDMYIKTDSNELYIYM